ncbi:tetratricopeptide repeat-containing sulfotransferase family protein [Dyella sp.]|uniref:tetratricopeptide repeat-containing sulfotransferase family protein n=1 Tax=Dyella sp. TaxID=1869338 RepID=UPI002ED13747
MNTPEQLYAQALQAASRQDWMNARALALEVLRQSPRQAGMHYVAGVAALETRQLHAALEHLRTAARLEPQRANFAAMHARALSLTQMPALAEAERAMALGLKDPGLLMMLGMVFSQGAAHARAADAFGEVVRLAPGYAPGRFSFASSLIFLGRADEAGEELEQCIAQDPAFWRAYLSRALLRRQSEASNHVQQLRRRLAQDDVETRSSSAQTYLQLALAKELEDLGHYDESFEHLTRGKAAARPKTYSSQADAALFQAMREAFAGAIDPDSETPEAAPIFVLGMPRSGTTLVDRILSSHPDIHSAGELLSFPLMFKQHSGSHTPRLLDLDTVMRSPTINWARLGADYIAHVRAGTGQAGRFIDKLPHNFLYVGAIARALPQAKIICLRRDPLDTCISNFRQLFGEDSAFHDYSYDLLDVGRHVVQFHRMVDHWQPLLPERLMQVQYEELVDSQEPVTRRMLEFCKLPWNDACLRFEANEAPVATASALQVRQPLHRGSIAAWKRYEPHLDALRALLAEAGIAT